MMRAADIGLCLVCVALGTAGQVLLRAASLQAAKAGATGPGAWLNFTTAIAAITYLSGMLLWMWVLSRVPITQAFAFFGLGFVTVPLLAHRWLGDPLTPHMLAGGAVIMAGIVLTNWPAR
jgi:undecaprenyl phosphate-alpha-L-ara4N flippase subunit ArnE